MRPRRGSRLVSAEELLVGDGEMLFESFDFEQGFIGLHHARFPWSTASTKRATVVHRRRNGIFFLADIQAFSQRG
jgi:hypothetical protein